MIAAPQGRSGKTTVSLGICAALDSQGLVVQPFKKGPDFIDPSWLSAAAGRACRTLDPFFHPSEAALIQAYLHGSTGADLSLIEANHGLYDDSLPDGGGSSAALARSLQAPILLVVNTARMGRSAAALVRGYQTFEAGTPLAGVILNNVANQRHETKLRRAIEQYCQIPVLGAIPRQEMLSIPDRHLGLVPRGEDEGLSPALTALREAAERYIDLPALLSMAGQASRLTPVGTNGSQRKTVSPLVRIGVLRDRAFSFYYPENLEALQAAGAELIYIDALHDPRLPAIQGLLIGGGFPEIFMDELSGNLSLRSEIRRAIQDGLPAYAECGGLMYLSRQISWQGRTAEMVGVLPYDVEMSAPPQGHGYVLAQVTTENPFLPVGSQLRGHEFHHSRLSARAAELPTAYVLRRGHGLGDGVDGLVYKNLLAGYTHLHAAGAPRWAPGLVSRACTCAGIAYRQEQPA